MLNLKSKKGQSTALISGLIFGIASLIIVVMISFVIVSTLTDTDLLSEGRVTTTVTNESCSINSTGDTLDYYSADNAVLSSFSILSVMNTTSGATVGSGNYTLTSGVITNATAVNYNDANVTYSYDTYTNTEISSDSMSANFTEGIDNVSSKLPTVLLVAAIVLILGILALLLGVWHKMRMGGGSL